MENQNFLQRPGGLGPAQKLKPLGGLGTVGASEYANTPATIEVRRSTSLDDINRVYSQYQVNQGEYARAAVGPTNYQEGNIMPSQQITGPAGYNHRDPLVTPMRPADINKAEYLVKEQNTMNPDMRAQMQMMTMLPQQNFYNVQDAAAKMAIQNYEMPDSLFMRQSVQKKNND